MIAAGKKWFAKWSATAVLRDRVAILTAENAKLAAKIVKLETELEVASFEHQKTNEQLQKLRKEHEEQSVLWNGIEFRRGVRTLFDWVGFCPSCHLPVTYIHKFGSAVSCPGNCGWRCEMETDAFVRALADFEKEFPREQFIKSLPPSA